MPLMIDLKLRWAQNASTFQPREKAKTRWRWNERRKFPFHLIIYTLIHRSTNLKWKPIELHKITAWWIPSCSLTQSLVYADFILYFVLSSLLHAHWAAALLCSVVLALQSIIIMEFLRLITSYSDNAKKYKQPQQQQISRERIKKARINTLALTYAQCEQNSLIPSKICSSPAIQDHI